MKVSHYGLAASVWCRDITLAVRTARALDSGWGQVNRGPGQLPGIAYELFREKNRKGISLCG
jgi:betaine-aldehyde dehydrogenase